MKILIDTNIIISASLYPHGTASKAFFKAVACSDTAIICETSIDELHSVYRRKFPDRLNDLESSLKYMLCLLEVVPVPDGEFPDEIKIRDEKDRPIFRAAVKEKADILLSGDKDFLEADVSAPKIVSPGDFLQMFKEEQLC